MVSPSLPGAGRRLLLMASAAFGLAWGNPAHGACRDWKPLDNRDGSSRRAVSAEDLIGLVNVGRPDAEPVGGPSPLAISPDGRQVAVILQRADLPTNGYCQAVVVLDVAGRVPPRLLDRGGDYLMTTVVMRDMYIPNGFPLLNAPAWSPDGRSIAYLRRDNGTTQLWRVLLDGKPAVQVTHGEVDVEAWSWGVDGRVLVYAAAPGRPAAEAAIDAEGRSGWRYDNRMAPNLGARPRIVAPLPIVAAAVDPVTGTVRAATDEDRQRLALGGEAPLERRRVAGSGEQVWAERIGRSPLAPFRLHATNARGAPTRCTAAACEGRIHGLWWDPDGRGATYVRSEGWNDRFTAVYRWTPGRGQPRRLLQTDDVLAGCLPAGAALACMREGATRPPRIVTIDLASGAQTLLFDPNPSFATRELGTVRRLEWRTARGLDVYGDLVLPRGYDGRTRLPSVVVQYTSRGFLRGGTGNDYPIFLLAARGFAVLSIQKPAQVGAADPSLPDFDTISQVNTRDWAERLSVNSAIEQGVRLLVARGIADPARLGITGLSDGASAVRFSLSTGRLFAAAAISSCCIDESSDILVGPAWAEYSRRIGYPPAYPVDSAFWRPYSLALNADHMNTPLLMQLADSELLYGLPAWTALRAFNQPVDLYVFPDEFHIKWQPVHRRATFERNLDWFTFWLQGAEDPAPAKAAQFARWRALRAARDSAVLAGMSPSGAASGP